MNFNALTMRRLLVVGLLMVLFPPWSARVAHADDAVVLPKGRFSSTLENLFYFTTGKRFNPHGNPEDIAGVFNNRLLDSTVFSLLRPLDRLVGGRASIGTSFTRFNYDYNILDIGLQYGVTDRLTAAIDIPYYSVKNTVKAVLDSGPGSGANVGVNTGPGPGVLPLGLRGVRRFTTEDVQQLLGPGLRGVPGFGFKRIRNFSADGLGDISAGVKYQYLRTQDWRLAATGGVRFPTGRQDDPDDLSDIAWSPGAYALLFRLHNDYIVSNVWKRTPSAGSGASGIPQAGDLILDFTVRYDYNFPTDVTVRVSDPQTPISTNRERVTRDLGDKFEFDFSGKYLVSSSLSLTALYKYGFKLEDGISDRMGFPVQFLVKDTDSTEQLFIVSASYSTLPLYMEKKFPIPLSVSLSYRDRFAGTGVRNAASPSQILKTRYISLGLQVLF